jgi:MinD superfamily P-loop ATPase
VKKLAVISGKGGTGKTMITAALATLIDRDLLLADCDVDAANLELLFSPKREETIPYYGMKVASIDQDTCVQCGSCIDHCRFDAISFTNGTYLVDPTKCEGCAVCTIVCPVKATSMVKRVNGEIFFSSTSEGPMAHARLEPGSGTTGLLVGEVKKLALDRGEGCRAFLIDGPPGIGCPLIASVSGVDAVLIVTEPSLSGLHDLERVARVAEGFGVDIFVAINRSTLEETVTRQIEDACRDRGIPVVGKIPFDETVIRAIRAGKPVTAYECPATIAIREMWDRLARELGMP